MLRLAIVAFAAGCAWLQTQATLPDLAWAWLLPVLAVAVGLAVPAARNRAGQVSGAPGSGKAPEPSPVGAKSFLGRPGERLESRFHAGARWLHQGAVLLLAGLSGFQYAAWRADLRLDDALPTVWQGRDIALTGRVHGLVQTLAGHDGPGLAFDFAVHGVHTAGAQVPQRIRLAWHAGRGMRPPAALRGGDCVRLTARLQRPHGQINGSGFDYEAWLFERGIRAQGKVSVVPVSAAQCGGVARAMLDRLREDARAGLVSALPDAPYLGVVAALAIGDQEAIPSQQWTLFRETGTSHLFSVSGLHVTLFSALIYALVRAIWLRVAWLNLWLPAHRAGLAIGLLAATAYTFLAGFGIPAQRTLYMLAAAVGVAWLDRRAAPSRLLGAALLSVVLLDPWAALSPGFWLSFSAVAVLIWTDHGLARVSGWRAWGRAQWAISIGLAPLLAALFQEISLVSPLANALAIPAISLLAVPLALGATLLPWTPLVWLAHAVVSVVMWVLEVLATLPQPVFHTAAPGWWVLFLAVLGAMVLLLPRGFPARWLGCVMCLPLIWPRLPAPAHGEAWITVLDVGQGAAVLVRTASHALLVDAGPRFVTGEDAGARVVAPHLWSRGIKRLDGMILTHDDMDHSGGVSALLESHAPRWFMTPLAAQNPARVSMHGLRLLARRPDALACVAGQSWQWDNVRFNVLHPPAHQYGNLHYADNERGCVLRIDSPLHSALLTADIEHLGEMNLAERNVLTRADVLLVPHHGSKSSSTQAFLDVVRPSLAVIPVGHRNRYGHPHPEVLARYRAMQVPVLRTDRHGAVHVRLGAQDGVKVESARKLSRRYWHDG